MQSKKAQGISVNMVIMVIIALLVLALILAFATGSFSRLTGKLKQTESTTDQSEIVAATTKCTQACQRARNIGISTQWTNTEYCDEIDFGDEKIHCWDPPINTWCDVRTKTPQGEDITCNPGTADAATCSQCA